MADVDQAIAPMQRAEIEAARRRSQSITFGRLAIPTDSVLTFAKDAAVTCAVSVPNTVRFEGQDLSLSQAALQAIHAMGYTWPTVNGFKYWMYDGVRLSTLAETIREREMAEVG